MRIDSKISFNSVPGPSSGAGLTVNRGSLPSHGFEQLERGALSGQPFGALYLSPQQVHLYCPALIFLKTQFMLRTKCKRNG